MSNYKTWFVIVNPTSGNGQGNKKWHEINELLNTYLFSFEYAFTSHHKHSIALVNQAIKEGFKKFICVGGDGTIHNMINGIMTQDTVEPSLIYLGVVPIGTGNDWIKMHQIPKDIKLAIEVIKKGRIVKQDLGKIEFTTKSKVPIYFNNIAGVGFDAHVVNNVEKYKYLGSLAYLVGALFSLFSFKNFNSKSSYGSKATIGKTFMVLAGIGKYSGGGMRLTKAPDPYDGLLDITIIKNYTKLDALRNLFKLYNGKIIDSFMVLSYKTDSILIETERNNELPFIQADGEIIGTGDIKITILPKAISFFSAAC